LGSWLWVVYKIFFNLWFYYYFFIYPNYISYYFKVYIMMTQIPEKFLWIVQRLSAIFLFLLFLWFVISIYSIELNDYEQTLSWIKKGKNSLILFLFSSIVFLHASLGLSVIVEDYIHNYKLKRQIYILKNSLIVICVSFSGICLYLI